MKWATLLIVTLALLPACDRQAQRGPRHPEMNEWMANSYYDDMSDNALIAQRTFYPHHFASGGAALNALGLKNTEVLAAHYRSHPSELNIRRGDASPELYEARVQTVRAAFEARGVEMARVAVKDGFAGGDGITSEQWTASRRPGQVQSQTPTREAR